MKLFSVEFKLLAKAMCWEDSSTSSWGFPCKCT